METSIRRKRRTGLTPSRVFWIARYRWNTEEREALASSEDAALKLILTRLIVDCRKEGLWSFFNNPMLNCKRLHRSGEYKKALLAWNEPMLWWCKYVCNIRTCDGLISIKQVPLLG